MIGPDVEGGVRDHEPLATRQSRRAVHQCPFEACHEQSVPRRHLGVGKLDEVTPDVTGVPCSTRRGLGEVDLGDGTHHGKAMQQCGAHVTEDALADVLATDSGNVGQRALPLLLVGVWDLDLLDVRPVADLLPPTVTEMRGELGTRELSRKVHARGRCGVVLGW